MKQIAPLGLFAWPQFPTDFLERRCGLIDWTARNYVAVRPWIHVCQRSNNSLSRGFKLQFLHLTIYWSLNRLNNIGWPTEALFREELTLPAFCIADMDLRCKTLLQAVYTPLRWATSLEPSHSVEKKDHCALAVERRNLCNFPRKVLGVNFLELELVRKTPF